MKRELTPVPPGYDQFTPKVVRSNAESMLVWHGRDADAVTMERAKQCIAEGQPRGAEIQMRILREIRRLLAKDEKGWLERHLICARSIAEGKARDAARGFPWPEAANK
jgi:hypothetical protein